MKSLAALLIIAATCLTCVSAHADDSGTDCWSPVAAQPLDLGLLGGPRAMLSDFKMTPAGDFKPIVLPMWVSMIPASGQHSETNGLEVRKIGTEKDEGDGASASAGDKTPTEISPVYVLEVGKKNGEAAPIVASGSRTGDLSGEGKLTIRNVVDIFGKATTGTNYLATRTGADIQFIRIPIGNSGVTFVGVTRGVLDIQSAGNSLTGSFQPGGGFALEIPTSSASAGESLRIGVIGGPSFNIGNITGSGSLISPAFSSGAQLLFF